LGNRDLIGGFVRLHVLHHASTGPIFGIGIIERLALHGYVLSPGTLYPILHGLERDGFLRSRGEVVGKKRRRIYEITDEGQKTLMLSKARLWELFKEVFDDELSPDTAGPWPRQPRNRLRSGRRNYPRAEAKADRGRNLMQSPDVVEICGASC
jgi:DNA-binding PadR family transcriptional regulator